MTGASTITAVLLPRVNEGFTVDVKIVMLYAGIFCVNVSCRYIDPGTRTEEQISMLRALGRVGTFCYTTAKEEISLKDTTVNCEGFMRV